MRETLYEGAGWAKGKLVASAIGPGIPSGETLTRECGLDKGLAPGKAEGAIES